jgi:hypothetical protein
VTGKAGGQDLAGHRGLAGGEVGEPEDPGAVDGVVDGLPCLEAGKRRLAGVENKNLVAGWRPVYTRAGYRSVSD